MENQKVNNNIFESVVIEPTAQTDAQTVLAIHLLIFVVPVANEDLKGCGLNE